METKFWIPNTGSSFRLWKLNNVASNFDISSITLKKTSLNKKLPQTKQNKIQFLDIRDTIYYVLNDGHNFKSLVIILCKLVMNRFKGGQRKILDMNSSISIIFII